MPSSVKSWLESLPNSLSGCYYLLSCFPEASRPNFPLCQLSNFSKWHKNRTNKEREFDCESTCVPFGVFPLTTTAVPETEKSTPQHIQNNNQTITTMTWLQEREVSPSPLQLSIWCTADEKTNTSSHTDIVLLLIFFFKDQFVETCLN